MSRDLRQTFVAAWGYWPCAQSRRGRRFKTDTVWVGGDEVRIQQVLVNIAGECA